MAFLNSLALSTVGGVANAWPKFGGPGATLTNVVRFTKLSVARNMETQLWHTSCVGAVLWA